MIPSEFILSLLIERPRLETGAIVDAFMQADTFGCAIDVPLGCIAALHTGDLISVVPADETFAAARRWVITPAGRKWLANVREDDAS